LLRAIARSELVHASNRTHVIRRLGGEPKAQIQTVEVNSTLENLPAALGDAIYEVDSMYPSFLAEERKIAESAAQTFTWALDAEKTHVRLLDEEINRMKAGRADPSASAPFSFYVRPVCGYVLENPEQEHCWDCDCLCSSLETVQ